MGGRQTSPRNKEKEKEYFVPVFFCFATPSSLCIEFAPPQQLQYAAFSKCKGGFVLCKCDSPPVSSVSNQKYDSFLRAGFIFFFFLLYLIARFHVKSLVIRRARRVLVASSRTSTRARGTRRARRELRRGGRVTRARGRLLLAGAASEAWTRG